MSLHLPVNQNPHPACWVNVLNYRRAPAVLTRRMLTPGRKLQPSHQRSHELPERLRVKRFIAHGFKSSVNVRANRRREFGNLVRGQHNWPRSLGSRKDNHHVLHRET
jgi:hypothetical protein